MNRWLNHDRLSGLVVFLFSVALFFLVIPKGVEMSDACPSGGLNPAFMPRLITCIMGGLSLLLLVRQPAVRPESGLKLFPFRTTVTAVLFVLYIIMVPLAGYLAATLVFLPVVLVFFGARNPAVVIPLSVLLPVLLYWFFSRVMFVLLPAGIWA